MGDQKNTPILLSDFQDKLYALDPSSFERFVADIIRSTRRFSDIVINSVIDGYQIDIIANEVGVLSTVPRKWFIETKRVKHITADMIHAVLGKMHSIQHGYPNSTFILVGIGNISAHAREISTRFNIEIWDAIKLADLTPNDIANRYFGASLGTFSTKGEEESKSRSLLESLSMIPAGKGAWNRFQILCSEILEYLFCPPLEAPRYEFSDADSRNRRDMIFENSGADGFWGQIRNIYSAHYIVADAKNHGTPLNKQPVLDIAHYLKPYGCGLFGILLSRKGAGAPALHALREQWIGGQKMIVVLSDSELEEMINIKAQGGKPEEVIRKAIADFRMAL